MLGAAGFSQCSIYVQNLVADEHGRVEHAPLNVDAGLEGCAVALARQFRCDHRAIQPEVNLVRRDGTAVQLRAGPFVGPYHLMVASVVDHHDSDVGAPRGEFPVPSGLAQDRVGPAFWLRGRARGGRRLAYGCHGFPPSVSCGRRDRLG